MRAKEYILVWLEHHGYYMGVGVVYIYLSLHPGGKLLNGYQFIPGSTVKNSGKEAKKN